MRLVSTPGCCLRRPHVQTPETDVQRDRGSRGRLCTVPDSSMEGSTVLRKYNRMCSCAVGGFEEITVPPKFKRLCTVPDGGLEGSTVPQKCNRLCSCTVHGLEETTAPSKLYST